MVGTHLAKDPSLVDVVVIAHPGMVSAKDFAEVKVPFALICSEGAFLPFLSRAFFPSSPSLLNSLSSLYPSTLD